MHNAIYTTVHRVRHSTSLLSTNYIISAQVNIIGNKWNEETARIAIPYNSAQNMQALYVLRIS